MANDDFPRGLWPVEHLTGGQIKTRPYILTTGQIIRRGEVVIAVAGGTVEDAASDDGAIVVGVSADYVDDSASAGGKIVNVYDDPDIIFGVQGASSVTPAATDVFAQSNISACSKTGVTSSDQTSDCELALDAGGQVSILGKIERPNNAWGEHVDLLVVFNEHIRRAVVAAV
jgi:hypothetical protein